MKYSMMIFFFISSILAQPKNPTPQITSTEVGEHIDFLASDKLEGRGSGSAGGKQAAEYIANEFRSYGLKPAVEGVSYFQPFEFVSELKIGKKNSLSATGPKKETITFSLRTDFSPLGYSETASFTGDVVFVGYGITNESKAYDDYGGIDIKGKAVMLLRYTPDTTKRDSSWNRYEDLYFKAIKARDKGAMAVLVVTGAADDSSDRLITSSLKRDLPNSGLPVINITRRTADRMLSADKRTIAQLQVSINGSGKPNSVALKKITVHLEAEVNRVLSKSDNVVGILPGADASLAREYVVLGAHYDHLGYGGEGSGSLQPDVRAIHNGADDNASGTAGVLELAQYFAARKNEIKRSLVFIAFSGEELGLLGSAAYVKTPTIPLEQTIAMLNMDMVGRLKNKKLIVYGIGTSPGFESLAKKYNQDSTFDLKLIRDGFGPSDQSSFYGKKIPVFHFFTDLHDDYHKPSDDADKINAEGEAVVLRYVARIATELANDSTRPQYAVVEQPKSPGGQGRSGVRSYTGTIPDMGEQAEGMKLSGVREGSPAQKAGLQAGDIIVKFGKVEIKNLYDYTYALQEYKPGDEVELVFKRGLETKTTKLTLGTRN
jgi:hypothetical protein